MFTVLWLCLIVLIGIINAWQLYRLHRAIRAWQRLDELLFILCVTAHQLRHFQGSLLVRAYFETMQREASSPTSRNR